MFCFETFKISAQSCRLHRSETTNTRQWDLLKAFDRQQQQQQQQQQQEQQQKMGVSDELQTVSKTSKNVRK